MGCALDILLQKSLADDDDDDDDDMVTQTFESHTGRSYMGGLCLPASSDHLNILPCPPELNFKPFSSCPKQEMFQRHQFLLHLPHSQFVF